MFVVAFRLFFFSLVIRIYVFLINKHLIFSLFYVFKACQRDLENHTEQINNLRKIASEIATEMDLGTSDLLQDEVEELNNRLEKVRQSISLLADIADARSSNDIECIKTINDVKVNLDDMKMVGYDFVERKTWSLFSLTR